MTSLTRGWMSPSSFVLFVGALGFFGAACADSSRVGSLSQDICPSPVTVEGVDVSEYQGTVNWMSVKASGREFALARVSDGTTHLDTTFSQNWSGMKSAGLVRGVYQLFEPGEDPVAQANIVIQNVGMLGGGDLPAVADVEVSGGQSAATIAANLKIWVDQVAAGTGKTPMIYTAPGWWSGAVGSSAFGGNPLWVANWGVSCPSLPVGWSNFSLWQYSDMGSVPGIPLTVDLDRFNGSLQQLQTFASTVFSDGGSPISDGSATDGSIPTSASNVDAAIATADASAPSIDANIAGDASTPNRPGPSAGCSCQIGTSRSTTPPVMWLLLVATIVVTRRRHAAGAHPHDLSTN